MPDGSIDMIPIDFTWDGSSVPYVFQGFFPRHRHPVSSAKHDYRCGKAKNKKKDYLRINNLELMWIRQAGRLQVGLVIWE